MPGLPNSAAAVSQSEPEERPGDVAFIGRRGFVEGTLAACPLVAPLGPATARPGLGVVNAPAFEVF